MNTKNISKVLYPGIIYIFLYLPIFVVIIFSFNNALHSTLWHGFTLKWYAQLFRDREIFTVVIHSLILGLLASGIATLLGTFAAVNLFRYKFCGKKILHGLIFILIVSPDIILGVALLVLYNVLTIPLGFYSLLIAHITFCIPFVAVTVYSRIVGLDKNIFEAARDLGANDAIVFAKIIVPLLLPAIVVGWLLSFTLSLDDVIISYFVSGPGFEILPLKIYSMVKLGVKPEVNALCTVMLLATITLVAIAQTLKSK